MGGFNTSVPMPSGAALDVKPPQFEDPLQALMQFRAQQQQRQLAQQQIQGAGLQNQLVQQKINDQKAIAQALQNWDPKTPATTIIPDAVKNGASGEAVITLQQHFADMRQKNAAADKEQLALTQTQHDKARGLLDAAVSAEDPAQKQQFWNQYKGQEQLLEPGSQVPDQYPGDTVAQTLSKGHALHSQLVEEGLKGQQTATSAAQAKEAEATAQKNTAEAGKINAEKAAMDALAGNPDSAYSTIDQILPPDNKNFAGQNRALRSEIQFYAAQRNGAGIKAAIDKAQEFRNRTDIALNPDIAKQKISIAVGSQQAAADTAEKTGALDLMAEQALNGQFTSRNPMLMARVYGRAAELAKDRGMNAQQVLMERNAAQANKGALDSVTKQYETLKPFAEMAEKNAEILEQKSAKVSNLGVPFLNTPLRDLESKFAGNPDVAAFRAALQPVQADFARILNSPTGGGVLSDDSRHEMQQAISPGATPAQIKAALDVFRQDAKNRKDSYEAQLADLKGKTVVGSGGTQPPKATHRFNSTTGKIEVIKP